MQIVEQTGLSWSGVNAALRLFEQGGAAALKPHARGKKPGSGRSLTPEQERAIRMTIIDKRPEQIKMEFALWSRPAVRELIERDLGLKLSVRSVGDYLARWGFTPQKPIKKAYEQRPEAVQAWLEDEYPAIEARAKREGAEIHWGDETALVNTDVRGRSYAPTGHPRRIPTSPRVCRPWRDPFLGSQDASLRRLKAAHPFRRSQSER